MQASQSTGFGSTRSHVLTAGAATGAMGGSVLAAAAASCCAPPVVVALFGATGALWVAAVHPYRWPLLVASALLLIVGFWRGYKAACCDSSRSARFTRGLLWVAGASCVSAATAPLWLGISS